MILLQFYPPQIFANGSDSPATTFPIVLPTVSDRTVQKSKNWRGYGTKGSRGATRNVVARTCRHVRPDHLQDNAGAFLARPWDRAKLARVPPTNTADETEHRAEQESGGREKSIRMNYRGRDVFLEEQQTRDPSDLC